MEGRDRLRDEETERLRDEEKGKTGERG